MIEDACFILGLIIGAFLMFFILCVATEKYYIDKEYVKQQKQFILDTETYKCTLTNKLEEDKISTDK